MTCWLFADLPHWWFIWCWPKPVTWHMTHEWHSTESQNLHNTSIHTLFSWRWRAASHATWTWRIWGGCRQRAPSLVRTHALRQVVLVWCWLTDSFMKDFIGMNFWFGWPGGRTDHISTFHWAPWYKLCISACHLPCVTRNELEHRWGQPD